MTDDQMFSAELDLYRKILLSEALTEDLSLPVKEENVLKTAVM